MMQVSEIQWSVRERDIVKAALQTARERETDILVKYVREQAGEVVSIDDIWRLHDFLSARRHYIDGKYDDRESGILFVLSGLVKEGWLAIDELDGLDAAKLAKVSALTRVL
ncbi:MAG: hypothetical protein AAFQ57_16695 [Cyanobacteria bacterium J06626_14]